ncbi:MAG: hypothetical protein IJS39_10140 [Synergistaceae bacterium]|nr:hypothetical protein [Synergistaceae bacterium]
MKKLLLKGSVFMLYVILIELVFPVLVDPFNVFHYEQLRVSGISPNSNYIKMKYILKHKDRFDGYSFMFGSSRVGYINPDKIPDNKHYNMTYSAGMPAEHLANVKTFLKNDIKPSRVYIGVDSYSYTNLVNRHIYEPGRCPYEYLCDDPLHFYSLYMNPARTLQAIAVMFRRQLSETNVKNYYRVGTTVYYGAKSPSNWDKALPSLGPAASKDIPQSISNTLRDIQELSEVCRSSGIDLVIFTNPMHHITYRASLELGYFDFLEGLARISDFWNFSGLNDITLSNDCYHETSHYKAEIGDMMIDAMCYGKADPKLQAQGFGFRVTRENVKAFMNMLKHQAESDRQKNSPAQ